MSNSAFKFKILLVGAAAVGKTSLISRFVKSSFETDYKLTVGVNILTKDVEYEPGEFSTLSIWDIGGQERFSFIRTTFYKGAHGVLIVFDLSRLETYNAVKDWLAEVKQFAGDVPFILVGNKYDLLAEVGEVIDRDEARSFAEDQGSIYIETSAKDGKNVEEAFTQLTAKIVDKAKN